MTETKNVSGAGCGVPVRDKGTSFIAIAVTGVAVAILAYLLRLGASVPKNGRQMSWDDATMGLVVALAIPPAVFAYFCKSRAFIKSTTVDLTITQWSTMD